MTFAFMGFLLVSHRDLRGHSAGAGKHPLPFHYAIDDLARKVIKWTASYKALDARRASLEE
jgi:hypothetical protein